MYDSLAIVVCRAGIAYAYYNKIHVVRIFAAHIECRSGTYLAFLGWASVSVFQWLPFYVFCSSSSSLMESPIRARLRAWRTSFQGFWIGRVGLSSILFGPNREISKNDVAFPFPIQSWFMINSKLAFGLLRLRFFTFSVEETDRGSSSMFLQRREIGEYNIDRNRWF